ncbi:hypothetical protein HID58_022316 [Brassica napus]|uniref:Uncharacterized protein n=1 Tax=Brassica napus TaxID=3708 RepID=A0ABQ8D0H8_BRANA|nr:hypothetical protein HID58_022316 [Brassica napus]
MRLSSEPASFSTYIQLEADEIPKIGCTTKLKQLISIHRRSCKTQQQQEISSVAVVGRLKRSKTSVRFPESKTVASTPVGGSLTSTLAP